MTTRIRQISTLIIFSLAAGVAAWAVLRFTPRLHWFHASTTSSANLSTRRATDLWTSGVEKAKEDRGEPAGPNAAVDVPSQLRHYSDTHWFLATQIAEVQKFNTTTCQDFVELAAMLQRGEVTSLSPATENYVLLGVGANADGNVFARFQDDHSVGLYDENELRGEYSRIDNAIQSAQREIDSLNSQLRNVKPRERAQRQDLQKQMSARQQQIGSLRKEKAELDKSYGNAATRNELLAQYQQLQTLAKNFAGRSYNLDDPSDRQALRISMLRSLRPQAIKVMEQLASDYHQQFNRPLPVSSLIRPEQYQHQLHRVNRNAVLIDTPPHSTGLAFDIDYRYMSAAEQTFVMNELARLKDEGVIEVLRERNANYHVFVFLDGKRPSDELIAASLEAAGAPDKEANHAEKPAKKERSDKSPKKAKPKAPRAKPKASAQKHRRH
jgi:hypothetical protein